ncbi:MAG: hypothetical protein AAGG51_25365 [Cyanobacteria bacterium P01_G01_bin.54]
MLNPTPETLSNSTVSLISGSAPLPPLPLPFASPLFVLQEGDRFAALHDLAQAVLRSTPSPFPELEPGIESSVDELSVEQWAEGLAHDVIAAND